MSIETVMLWWNVVGAIAAACAGCLLIYGTYWLLEQINKNI